VLGEAPKFCQARRNQYHSGTSPAPQV